MLPSKGGKLHLNTKIKLINSQKLLKLFKNKNVTPAGIGNSFHWALVNLYIRTEGSLSFCPVYEFIQAPIYSNIYLMITYYKCSRAVPRALKIGKFQPNAGKYHQYNIIRDRQVLRDAAFYFKISVCMYICMYVISMPKVGLELKTPIPRATCSLTEPARCP